MNSVELLYDCKNTLGEGITYSSINNNLYWLDINNVSKLSDSMLKIKLLF